MTIKIGINGFGRMGRLTMRAAFDWDDIEIVHINDPAGNAETLAHLLNFDSVQGRWHHDARSDAIAEKTSDGEVIIINNKTINCTQNVATQDTDWSKCDVVIEASGKIKTKALLQNMLKEFSNDQLALHFHDTYGQAIANQYVALELGFRRFDSSVAGLGGCPYAQGASGNVSTEDLVYMLEGAGMNTGIDLDKLILAGHQICRSLNRANQSNVANAHGFHPEGGLQ